MYNYRIYKNRLQSMQSIILQGGPRQLYVPSIAYSLEFSHWLFVWFAVQFLQETLIGWILWISN